MPAGVPAMATDGLGKRYGSTWAIHDCSLSVPQGKVTALVGPNGAGKTTLLRTLVGLTRPTAGRAEVLGHVPAPTADYLDKVGYLAHDAPLYRRLTATDHLAVGAHLNRRWDAAAALARLAELRVPLDRPVATLSGGQRAQVGLAMVLAKRPQVLLLDEPVAALDPLARRQFLASLSTAIAEDGVSVVLSSHLLHDLERVCDHVILLASSHVQLCADIDDVLASHRMLVGPRRSIAELERTYDVVRSTQTERQSRLLVRLRGPVVDPSFEVAEVGREDIVVAYMSRDEPAPMAQLVSIGESA
jgi:ABC-2 type transport system ATP-binding protein